MDSDMHRTWRRRVESVKRMQRLKTLPSREKLAPPSIAQTSRRRRDLQESVYWQIVKAKSDRRRNSPGFQKVLRKAKKKRWVVTAGCGRTHVKVVHGYWFAWSLCGGRLWQRGGQHKITALPLDERLEGLCTKTLEKDNGDFEFGWSEGGPKYIKGEKKMASKGWFSTEALSSSPSPFKVIVWQRMRYLCLC